MTRYSDPAKPRNRNNRASHPDDHAGLHLGVAENRGSEYSTLNSRILIIRTPTKGTPNFWKLPSSLKEVSTTPRHTPPSLQTFRVCITDAADRPPWPELEAKQPSECGGQHDLCLLRYGRRLPEGLPRVVSLDREAQEPA